MKEIDDKLLTLCEQTLEIDDLKEDMSLVMQGASSMRLMQLVARVYEELGVIIELNEVMENVTLAEIVAMVEQRTTPVSMSTTEEAREFPLNDLQLPFWEMRHYAPAMVAYNEAVSYLVEGPLDVEICQKVLLELTRTQPALRTAF